MKLIRETLVAGLVVTACLAALTTLGGCVYTGAMGHSYGVTTVTGTAAGVIERPRHGHVRKVDKHRHHRYNRHHHERGHRKLEWFCTTHYDPYGYPADRHCRWVRR